MKGQASMEFMEVFILFFLIIMVFAGVFVQKGSDTSIFNTQSKVFHFADEISNTINIVSTQGHGSSIELTLPQQVVGKNYQIIINESAKTLDVITDDGLQYASVFVVTGDIEVIQWNYGTTQTIENVNGRVIIK